MSNDDVEYYRRRAEAEATRALEARTSIEAEAHSQLATLLMDRVEAVTKQTQSRRE